MRGSSSLAALATIGLIVLSGCSTSETNAPETTPPDTTTADTTTAQTTAVPDPIAAADAGESNVPPPCTAANMTATLGTVPGTAGQVVLPLRYTNTGSSPCAVTGFPGATLQGPDDGRFGPEYQLPRSDVTPSDTIALLPGTAAVADLTLGTAAPDDADGWQPDALLTIAPGDTEVMTVPLPEGIEIQRQDGATRPASYIGAFTGPVA